MFLHPSSALPLSLLPSHSSSGLSWKGGWSSPRDPRAGFYKYLPPSSSKTGSLCVQMPQFPPLTAPSGKSFNAINSQSAGNLSVACPAVGGDSPEASRGRLNFLFSSGVLGHRSCNPEVGQCFHWGLCQTEATPSLQGVQHHPGGWDSVIES